MNKEDCSTPEEYLLALIAANRGKETCIPRDELILVEEAQGLEVPKNAAKRDIAELLLTVMDARELAACCEHIGVSSYEMQEKFGVTNAQLKKLANAGLLNITGTVDFRKYGRDLTAPLYDIWQYFELTPDELKAMLKQIDRRKTRAGGERSV